MTKEQFLKYMGIIHKRYDTLEMLYYDLEKLTGVVSDRIINETSVEKYKSTAIPLALDGG